MVALIPGVTKELPVPTGVPPVSAVYQLMVVSKVMLATAARVTEPASQRLAGVTEDMTGTAEIMVAATAVLPADTQPEPVIAPA